MCPNCDGYTSTDAHSHSYCGSVWNTVRYTNRKCKPDANGNSYRYHTAYCYTYSQADTHSQTEHNPKNTANSSTPPLAHAYEKQAHYSIWLVQPESLINLRSHMFDRCPDNFRTGFLKFRCDNESFASLGWGADVR